MPAPRVFVVIIATAALAIAFRTGGLALWTIYAAGLTVAAAIAVFALWQDEILRDVTRRKGFDLMTGLLTAVAMYALITVLFTKLIAPPDASLGLLRRCAIDGPRVPRLDGAPALEWIRRQTCLGYGRSLGLLGPWRGVFVVAIAALEELAWRGGVQQALSEKFGSTRGWLAATALYACAQLTSGNPLLAALALGTGLVWGALYRYRGRLPPAIASHAVFAYALYHWGPLVQFN